MIESKLPQVGTTIFTRMSALANEHGAVNLSQGFPDFEAPGSLLEALGRHALAGHNQYAPMAGVPALRQQIAAHLEKYRGVVCDPEQEITVLPGATEGIYCAITACVRPGDEVIVFDPCYDSYEPSIELAGGRAVHIPMEQPGITIDWDRVETAITANTRMIVINSPHNGYVATTSAGRTAWPVCGQR
jgi:methionine aminotransferase